MTSLSSSMASTNSVVLQLQIPNHVMKCSACPFEIKNALKELKEQHQVLKHSLPKGAQKGKLVFIILFSIHILDAIWH